MHTAPPHRRLLPLAKQQGPLGVGLPQDVGFAQVYLFLLLRLFCLQETGVDNVKSSIPSTTITTRMSNVIVKTKTGQTMGDLPVVFYQRILSPPLL